MPAVNVVAFRKLQDDLGGEAEVMRELLDTFFDEAPKLVDAMQTSLAKADTRTLNRSAHSLKSTSATFGAAHLSDLCRTLEAATMTAIPPDAAPRVAEIASEWARVQGELAKLRP